jgi:signal transduction histidine kinase
VLIKDSEAQEIGVSDAQISRIVHELKSSMSVLLLVISSLKENSDQSPIFISRIEDAVAEINHLVNEMIGLVERRDKTI